MSVAGTPIQIVIAEDDPDDRLRIEEALAEARLANGIKFVADGVELLEYLRGTGRYCDLSRGFLPGLVLLDLNMPRMDGREVLKEIKEDPILRRVPVAVLTTSSAQEDIRRTYDLGVNSFITKPVTFERLVAVMQSITNYWFQIVHLPSE